MPTVLTLKSKQRRMLQFYNNVIPQRKDVYVAIGYSPNWGPGVDPVIPVETDTLDTYDTTVYGYQTYKEITKTLKEKEELRKEIYTKAPEDMKDFMTEGVNITDELNIDDLVDAFKKFLLRQKENKPIHTQVTEKEVTVAERRKRIKDIIFRKKKVSFFELFEDYSREYVVATFLAVLEMAKAGELTIKQEKTFDDIICEVGNGK